MTDGIPPLRYLGAKLSAPSEAGIAQRLRLLETIARAASIGLVDAPAAPRSAQ